MSLVEQFGPHLPFLRRYARALTGSQESGDSYIRASLTALAEDPSQVSEELPARQALYRFFHVIWGSTGARLERRDGSGGSCRRRLRGSSGVKVVEALELQREQLVEARLLDVTWMGGSRDGRVT